jgi:hypothetical protein
MKYLYLLAVAPACAFLVACGSEVSVADYCAYGAVSEAQLDGCIDHVDESDVERLDTNAAQYGRGELDKCLSDAGPFCGDEEAIDESFNRLDAKDADEAERLAREAEREGYNPEDYYGP